MAVFELEFVTGISCAVILASSVVAVLVVAVVLWMTYTASSIDLLSVSHEGGAAVKDGWVSVLIVVYVIGMVGSDGCGFVV